MGEQRNRTLLTCCSYVTIILSSIIENHDIILMITKIFLKLHLNWNLFLVKNKLLKKLK